MGSPLAWCKMEVSAATPRSSERWPLVSDVAKKYGSIPHATREKIQEQLNGVQSQGIGSAGETVQAQMAVPGNYSSDNTGSAASAPMSPEVAKGVEKASDNGPMGRVARDYAAAHTGEPAAPAKQDAAHKYGSASHSRESVLSAENQKAVDDIMKDTGVKGAGAGQSAAEKYGTPPPRQDKTKVKEKEGPSK